MFHPPDADIQDRMLRACRAAPGHLGLRGTAGTDRVWGYDGRTLSTTITTPRGRAWLRLVSAHTNKAHGKLWDGPRDAQTSLPPAVPRPQLMDLADWTDNGWSYRAELYELLTSPVVSASPVLEIAPDLPAAWWRQLRDAVDTLATAATTRVAVREEYILRRVPEFTSVTPGEIEWTVAHGDLHWANLAGPDLQILDWEAWGRAPYGYDAAILYLHTLPAPETSATVHDLFADILNSPRATLGSLVACTELLQAAPRVPFYAALEPHVRAHLARLLAAA